LLSTNKDCEKNIELAEEKERKKQKLIEERRLMMEDINQKRRS